MLVAFKRPTVCSPLLVCFVPILIVKLSLVITPLDDTRRHILRTATGYISLIAAGLACCFTLLMPFREASAVTPSTSAVGQQPSSQSRSPEDNLRLWQFLSVSWLAPLLSVGKERQLNETDVWSLPFEFQHQRLHDCFSQLKGSVLGRLLQANGIDVLIITLITIVRMVCGMLNFVL